MNNWISVKDRLPEENKFVLIHLAKDNWADKDDPEGIYYKVARIEHGITQKQRDEYLSSNDFLLQRRAIIIKSADEHGNNIKPYAWGEFGFGHYFGQEVDYWMPLPELPKKEGE